MRMIEIQGTNMELTLPIKQHVEKKLETVAKLTEGMEPCDVATDVGRTSNHHQKGDVFKAEFMLTIPNAKLRSEAVKDDLYAAIDTAVDQLKRQVKEYKEKLRDAEKVEIETAVEEWSEDEEIV